MVLFKFAAVAEDGSRHQYLFAQVHAPNNTVRVRIEFEMDYGSSRCERPGPTADSPS